MTCMGTSLNGQVVPLQIIPLREKRLLFMMKIPKSVVVAVGNGMQNTACLLSGTLGKPQVQQKESFWVLGLQEVFSNEQYKAKGIQNLTNGFQRIPT